MKAQLVSVFHEDWTERVALNPHQFEHSLKQMGLSKELVHKYQQELAEATRDIHHQSLVAKWNDPRYERYRNRANRLVNNDWGVDLGRRGVFESGPTDEELQDFEREMTGVAHYSDGEHATRFVNRVAGALKRILGLIDQRTEGEQFEEIKVPLFKFQSPDVPGSEVVFEESQSEELTDSYALSVFGTGMGTTRTIFFSHSNVLESRDGAYKLAYTPINIRKVLVGVYEKKRRVHQFLRTESVFNEESELEIGVDELTQAEFLERIQPVAPKGRFYRLSGDRTSSVHAFIEVLKVVQDFKWEVGVKAFNLDATCKAQISRTREVKLEFKLPAGHDYQMKKIMGGLGIMWVQR